MSALRDAPLGQMRPVRDEQGGGRSGACHAQLARQVLQSLLLSPQSSGPHLVALDEAQERLVPHHGHAALVIRKAHEVVHL